MTAVQPSDVSGTGDSGARAGLGVLVFAWGAQAIVAQSLLLREALVLMYGSELAWGIVLFAWLLGVALGAVLGGRMAETQCGRTHAAGLLLAVLLGLSAATCADLWIFRGARAWLGAGVGELLPLPRAAWAALLFITPVGALVGAAFPLACRVGQRLGAAAVARGGGASSDRGAPYLSFARVYGLESAGSLAGGAAFSFWAVEHLAPVQTALVSAGVTVLACGALLATIDRVGRRCVLAGLSGVLATGVFLVAALGGDRLNRQLVARRWQTVAPGYDLVAEAESKYQNLAVGQRAGQYTLYCDGHVAANFPDPYTSAPLAHFWLCQHPAPRSVLVLGGAAEGLLAEILRYPVAHVDYVEPDALLIGLLTPLLTDTDRAALTDPRVSVHYADARYYIKTQRARFDLVIARLPEPTAAQRARFYTDEFFAELRRAMTPHAVLGTTAAATPTELSGASREYLSGLRATLRRHFAHVVIGWGDPAQVLAATADGLITTDPAELAARYRARQVAARLFDPAWFAGATDWLDARKLARRSADLDAAGPVTLSTDLHPAIYLQRLALWESLAGGAAGGGRQFVAWLRTLRFGPVAGGLAVLGLVTLTSVRLRHRNRQGWVAGAIMLTVATTGFVTMALSIVLLFAFQNLYGYVYQRIGWIVALFMGGLVVGCVWAGRRAARRNSSVHVWRSLIAVDVLLAILALATPPVLHALATLQHAAAVEWSISMLVAVTGLFGGATFALAGHLQLTLSGRAGGAAGSVVGADHAGACLGALLCGVLLVPVFGTVMTAWLLAALKLSSAATLAALRRPAPRA